MRGTRECIYAGLMKTFNFRIVPLATEVVEGARLAAATGVSDHVMLTADSPNSYPCRHCLHWANPGERVILFAYASVPPGRPYSETGPIFVHVEPCKRYDAIHGYPPDFRNGRVFRAYDADYNMIDAVVVNGSEPEVVIEKLFENPETKFLQARSVTRGCYTFGVERI